MPLPSSLQKPRRELVKFWLRFRVAIIATLVAVIVLGSAPTAWQFWRQDAAESRGQEALETARGLVEGVRGALGTLVGTVDAQLEDGDALLDALASGDVGVLRAKEQELLARVPGALGVRILAEPLRDPDYAALPPITFASLEMMRAALETGESPKPEVLLSGEKEQHVAVVRPLKRSGADQATGLVVVGLDVTPLAAAIGGARLSAGYAELVQSGGRGRAVVGRTGNASAKQGVPAASVAVPGSTLRVQYWDGVGVKAPPEERGGLPLAPIAGGLAVLVLGGLWFVRRRKRSDARSKDKDGKSRIEDRLAQARASTIKDSGEQPAVEVTFEDEFLEQGDNGAAAVADVIFRAYDIRGVVGETLTLEVVKQIGLAIGSEAYDRGQQTVCVGCDGRSSSPELVAALVEGLRESGRDVIDVGRVPTPVLYFATHYLETGSGVMVTGSHNPPEYNGLKMMLGGDTLFGDDIQALKTRIQTGEFTSGAGNLQTMDISADYIRRVSEDVPVALGNAFKVVIDCGNGVAGDFAPKLIRALGHDVVELYCDVDGSFPNHHPDPSQPENLEDLIAAVKDNEADIGFAFDGDGDRLGVVDATGRIVWPDSQMMLFARDVLSRHAGAEIVFDVKCSSRLAKVIAKLGGKPVMFKTGHSYIKNKLKETGAPLAGEMSGHIFFKERWYGFDDALYAASRMLEILMGFKETPADVFAKLPVGVSTPELRVDMEEGENLDFMNSLGDTSQFADAEVTTIDGVRVDWKDCWGLVRASNTTPSLVLRFEGDDEEALARVKEIFRKLLLEKKPDLLLPF